ncbi:hypothetical protein B0T14DRAFT_508344 [Immersiella caudata]|uniref:Uncharacterized protein n=1 Tax=Immersiella caudata TaxID=314043 RepID=A0AA39XI25_9PEZI|nr:hypothetical protein B0T14DRAFT_508344 [Immersiella caudata]
MSNPIDETEPQRLMEERRAILACLAVCEAAQASVDEAERQLNTQKDDKRVISSLSELIGTSVQRSNRYSQPDERSRTSSSVDGDTASPPQRTDLAHRQRESQSTNKAQGCLGARMGGREDSAAGSQEESQEESQEDSFVMVENSDEEDPKIGHT